MTVTTVTHAADASIACTDVANMVADEWATTAKHDNASDAVDVLVGGMITCDANGVAGDTFDIYVSANYSSTEADVGGAVDGLLNADDTATVTTHFIPANLVFLTSIALTASTADDLHWGPVSIASAYGGTMPRKFMLVVHANGAQASTAANCNAIAVTYTHT